MWHMISYLGMEDAPSFKKSVRVSRSQWICVEYEISYQGKSYLQV